MLVIESVFGSTAITWDSVESICFDDKSCAPDTVLRIATKGGNIHTAVNPTDCYGVKVGLDVISMAWLDDYAMWKIKENNSSKAPTIAP